MLAASIFAPETGSDLKPEEIDVRPKNIPKPKGLKKFIIGGKEIWAINEKNANRKYKQLSP